MPPGADSCLEVDDYSGVALVLLQDGTALVAFAACLLVLHNGIALVLVQDAGTSASTLSCASSSSKETGYCPRTDWSSIVINPR